MYSKEVLDIVRRLQEARLSIMHDQPFYAVLLLHMRFSLDEMCETAYTDGEVIAFCPDFIGKLSDTELEFVLMHEVLHAALNHCGRGRDGFDFDDFNTACDIVVNSNILYSSNMSLPRITLSEYGVSMHTAPDGKEGYLYSAEEVYGMLKKKRGPKIPGLPVRKDGNSEETPARSDGGFDDHTFWGPAEDDESGQEGDEDQNGCCDGGGSEDGSGGEEGGDAGSGFGADEQREIWLQRMVEATQIAKRVMSTDGGTGCGRIPLGAERLVKELTQPQTDWRTVLDTFVQEEVTDYSFDPPDRRFQDSPFLLPDYNEKDDSVKDVLFMIDTSGSMSDGMITQAYSEIYGAIQQFGGRLQGWLGFFDAEVVEPKEFTDEEEFRVIRPAGGGGTSFHCIFEYVEKHADEMMPASIVILTDGYAPFPDEKAAMGIPVLWLINNEKVDPPWGRVTRIKAEL